jgi:GT2 family glycosyltransferase
MSTPPPSPADDGGSSVPRTTVVIPHYRAETLSACLQSLRDHTGAGAIRILVVDDGGNGPALQAAQAAFPDVEVLHNDQRLGFTGSCNHGLAQATTEFVLLLNDDTHVTPGWLAPLLAACDADERIGACQPKLLSATRAGYFDYSGGAGGYIDSLGYTFCRGRLFDSVEQDDGQYEESRPLFWACGSAMFLRRQAVEQVGPLDLDYFMHFEEIDLCWRLRLAGWRILSVPSSTIYHHAAQSLPPDTFLKVYLNHRNNLIALLKNWPAGRLLTRLPLRLALEVVASAAYLAGRRWHAALAPWAGLGWIALHPLSLWRRRRASRRLATAAGDGGPEGVYRGSALWAYHVQRRRTATALMEA